MSLGRVLSIATLVLLCCKYMLRWQPTVCSWHDWCFCAIVRVHQLRNHDVAVFAGSNQFAPSVCSCEPNRRLLSWFGCWQSREPVLVVMRRRSVLLCSAKLVGARCFCTTGSSSMCDMSYSTRLETRTKEFRWHASR